MTLERVIATATQLAASVEARHFAQALDLARSVTHRSGQAELQTVAIAGQRVVDALAGAPISEAALGSAMMILAEEIALLIDPPDASPVG